MHVCTCAQADCVLLVSQREVEERPAEDHQVRAQLFDDTFNTKVFAKNYTITPRIFH